MVVSRPLACILALTTLASLLLATTPAGAQDAAVEAREPILVAGDDDLCDAGDTKDGIDEADGVRNCATADGSAERPYRIGGHRIVLIPDDAPCGEGVGAGCPVVPACPGAVAAAAVSLCSTNLHVILEDLELETGAAWATTDAGRMPLAGILANGSGNVTLSNVTVRAAGTAFWAEGPANGPLRVRSGAFGPPSDLERHPVDEDRPLVQLRAVDAHAAQVTLDALERKEGMRVDGVGPFRTLDLTDATVRDAQLTGVTLRRVAGTVERVSFVENGLPGFAQSLHQPGAPGVVPGVLLQTAGRALALENGTYDVRENTFLLRGLGIDLLADATGRVEQNRFASSADASGVDDEVRTAVLNEDDHCRTRLEYNSLRDTRIVNFVPECLLGARHNWWGGPNGPGATQTDGPVDSAHPLPVDLDNLPVVTIQSPQQGQRVHGQLRVAGTAASQDGSALERVEATFAEGSWDDALEPTGRHVWQLVVDLDNRPLGDNGVSVRACTTTTCGVPDRVGFEVVHQPVAPVALLTVEPRRAEVGRTVLLDASGSYSPDGHEILAFRFHLGDGSNTSWGRNPTARVAYAQPGEYVAWVEVEDEQGLRNVNPARVMLRVVDTDDAHVAGGVAAFVPGPPLPLLLIAAAASACLASRRRARCR